MFGEAIVEYSFLILPLVVLAVLTAYLWFINDLLITIRDLKGGFVANIVASIIAFVVCWGFVDYFGMNGVSFTGIVAYAIGIVLGILFVCHKLMKRFTYGLSSKNE